MTTTTPESPTNQRRPAGDLGAAQQWLDALSSGGCDEATFLRAVQDLIRKSPDTGWELLSLLDQYYRRGKLSLDLFRTLKSQLESQLLGASLDIDVSVPMTKNDDLSRTAQVTASHPSVADRMRSQRQFVPSPSSGAGAAGSAGAGAANHFGDTTTPSAAARAFVRTQCGPGGCTAGGTRAESEEHAFRGSSRPSRNRSGRRPARALSDHEYSRPRRHRHGVRGSRPVPPQHTGHRSTARHQGPASRRCGATGSAGRTAPRVPAVAGVDPSQHRARA